MHALHDRLPVPRIVVADPERRGPHAMSAGSFTAGFASPHALRAGLGHLFVRLLPADRRLLRRSAPPSEATLAAFGLVELRHTCPGFVARTTVKGDRATALRTASQRLADYAGGQNRCRLEVRTARPVTQRRGAPGTWLVQIGLPGVYAASAAPRPRCGKVRIMAQPSETLAIIRLTGRPRGDALARGEAGIRAAIAGSKWIASGPAALRLHEPPGLLPWTGGFEVAMAVTEA